MSKHINITITGHVQGVFFRHSAYKKAHELNLKGYVQNKDDGDVYVEVEGENDALDAFVDWCHRGSMTSRVDHVHVHEGSMEHFEHFHIR